MRCRKLGQTGTHWRVYFTIRAFNYIMYNALCLERMRKHVWPWPRMRTRVPRNSVTIATNRMHHVCMHRMRMRAKCTRHWVSNLDGPARQAGR